MGASVAILSAPGTVLTILTVRTAEPGVHDSIVDTGTICSADDDSIQVTESWGQEERAGGGLASHRDLTHGYWY